MKKFLQNIQWNKVQISYIPATLSLVAASIILAGSVFNGSAPGGTFAFNNLRANQSSADAQVLTASPNPIMVCNGGGVGNTTFSWTVASGLNIELRKDGETGQLIHQTTGSGTFQASNVGNSDNYYLYSIATTIEHEWKYIRGKGWVRMPVEKTNRQQIGSVVIAHTRNGCDAPVTPTPTPLPPPPPPAPSPQVSLAVSVSTPARITGSQSVISTAVTGGTATKVEIYIDDKLKTTLYQTPYNYTWDNISELDPVHIITAKAYAADGGVFVSEAKQIILDDLVPDLSGLPKQVARSTNIALHKPVTVSKALNRAPATQAVDGSEATGWNAGDFAQQWISVDLGGRNLVEAIELVVGQYPIEGITRHEVHGIGSDGEEGLLFAIESKTTNGQTIHRDFSPPLRNIKGIRVTTTKSPSFVSWREIRVLGSALPTNYSTNIINLRSASYYNPGDYISYPPGSGHNYSDFGQYFDLARFSANTDKLKTLGFNSTWMLLDVVSFYHSGTDISYQPDEQAFAKLTQAVAELDQKGMRAILGTSYGSYPSFALYGDRNSLKIYKKFTADLSSRLRGYNNIVFMNFSEGGNPSVDVGSANTRSAPHDKMFKDWLYSVNPDIAYWNQRWGTSYTWDTVRAYRYPTADFVNNALTTNGQAKCTDDWRWISNRLRQFYRGIPSIQAQYGNPAWASGFHDGIVTEGWVTSPSDAPIAHPNPYDIVSTAIYADGRIDCGGTNNRPIGDPNQWITSSEFFTKMNRLTSQFPLAQPFIGEVGVQTIGPNREALQAEIVRRMVEPIVKQKGWGFSFWTTTDTRFSDDAGVFMGMFRTNGTAKPVAGELARLLGGTVPVQ